MSQETFPELVGMHRTYVGAVERGERNLTLATVERYAGRIGAPPTRTTHGAITSDATPTPPRTS